MKTRPVLIIIVTLIIGFILGMLTSAQLRVHRLKPMRVYFSEERFRDAIYRTIQPDEAQKAKIETILDKYARMNSDLQSKFRKELDSNMKDLRKELDRNLTRDQVTRLREMDKRREEMIKQAFNRHKNDSSRFYKDMHMEPGDHFIKDREPSPEVPPPPPPGEE